MIEFILLGAFCLVSIFAILYVIFYQIKNQLRLQRVIFNQRFDHQAAEHQQIQEHFKVIEQAHLEQKAKDAAIIARLEEIVHNLG